MLPADLRERSLIDWERVRHSVPTRLGNFGSSDTFCTSYLPPFQALVNLFVGAGKCIAGVFRMEIARAQFELFQAVFMDALWCAYGIGRKDATRSRLVAAF